MATRKLNSIKFPDLPDTYILDAEKVEYSASGTYPVGSVGKALQDKADKAGTYSELTSGSADTILSDSTTENITPYSFRKTPVNADREYLDKVVGGSVAFNQLSANGNFESTEAFATFNTSSFTVANNVGNVTVNESGTGSVYLPSQHTKAGHKYLLSVMAKADDANHSVTLRADSGFTFTVVSMAGTAWTLLAGMAVGESDASTGRILVTGAHANMQFQIKEFVYYDLTQMFGSTVADAIYAMETATAGSGVAYLKSVAPKMFSQYNAYDAGSIESVEATAHKTVGFNAWDEETADGYWDDTGFHATDRWKASKNYNKCLPNTAYYMYAGYAGTGSESFGALFFYDANMNFLDYLGSSACVNKTFTTPNNAQYFTFYARPDWFPYKFCINISDTSKNGTYEPYNGHSYPLANVTLRGIPKWDNGLYYDGDEYNADGTVVRKYGVVDLGTVTWTLTSGVFRGNFSGAKVVSNSVVANIACSNYVALARNTLINGVVGVALNADDGFIWIYDSAYADATAFKTAMNGVYLVYELATPTTESVAPFTNVQICDGDGTEEFVSNSIVPTGHSTRYPKDLKSVLEDIADAPSANGTYILKATVSASGTVYEWVAE